MRILVVNSKFKVWLLRHILVKPFLMVSIPFQRLCFPWRPKFSRWRNTPLILCCVHSLRKTDILATCNPFRQVLRHISSFNFSPFPATCCFPMTHFPRWLQLAYLLLQRVYPCKKWFNLIHEHTEGYSVTRVLLDLVPRSKSPLSARLPPATPDRCSNRQLNPMYIRVKCLQINLVLLDTESHFHIRSRVWLYLRLLWMVVVLLGDSVVIVWRIDLEMSIQIYLSNHFCFFLHQCIFQLCRITTTLHSFHHIATIVHISHSLM